MESWTDPQSTLYLFELSGEPGPLPLAEATSCISAECDEYRIVANGPGYVLASFCPTNLERISKRLGLTRHIGRYLGAFEGNPADVDCNIPEGSFAIRGRRFGGMMGGDDSQSIIRSLGNAFSKNNDVNLKSPDITIRALFSDKVHVYLEEATTEREELEQRKVSERPFFSPISLHPKYARTLINLTRTRTGGKVLDPFCGTGGIAMEAAKMGMRVSVSDFDENMVYGTLENMDYYGFDVECHRIMDVGDIPQEFKGFDAIATDPPYGRSTRTGGESIDDIYRRAMDAIPQVLSSEGHAGIIFPRVYDPQSMRLMELHAQKVHGSLSRYYHIFKKP